MVVLTDHYTIKGIVEKTTLDTISVDQANRCLIAALIYLTEYNLKVYHIPGYLNTVPDTLLRLPADTDARD